MHSVLFPLLCSTLCDIAFLCMTVPFAFPAGSISVPGLSSFSFIHGALVGGAVILLLAADKLTPQQQSTSNQQVCTQAPCYEIHLYESKQQHWHVHRLAGSVLRQASCLPVPARAW